MKDMIRFDCEIGMSLRDNWASLNLYSIIIYKTEINLMLQSLILAFIKNTLVYKLSFHQVIVYSSHFKIWSHRHKIMNTLFWEIFTTFYSNELPII